MTNDDRVAALSLAAEEHCRVLDETTGKRRNIGGLNINKSNGKGAYGMEVSDLLFRNNGTLRWDMDDPRNGIETFDNIFQYMAAEIHAPGARQKDRVLIGDQYEGDMRSGIASCARWLDEQFAITLYKCTSSRRKNQIVVITVLPQLIVDEETGQTALEHQRHRDDKAIAGQVKAMLTRQARVEGERVREVLRDKLVKAIDETEIPQPRRATPLKMIED